MTAVGIAHVPGALDRADTLVLPAMQCQDAAAAAALLDNESGMTEAEQRAWWKGYAAGRKDATDAQREVADRAYLDGVQKAVDSLAPAVCALLETNDGRRLADYLAEIRGEWAAEDAGAGEKS